MRISPFSDQFPYHCGCMLRQIIIGFLAVVFIFSATELHQLLRIPALISHYNLHAEKDASISIWDFLQLHYAAVHPEDNDEGDDQELPFKSIAGLNHLDQPWNEHLHYATTIYFRQATVHNFFYRQGHPCNKVDGIFHPPRL